MSPALAAIFEILLVGVVLALIHVPLGNYIARIFTSARHLRVESGLYRVLRIDPKADQRWFTYAISVVAFSVVWLSEFSAPSSDTRRARTSSASRNSAEMDRSRMRSMKVFTPVS